MTTNKHKENQKKKNHTNYDYRMSTAQPGYGICAYVCPSISWQLFCFLKINKNKKQEKEN